MVRLLRSNISEGTRQLTAILPAGQSLPHFHGNWTLVTGVLVDNRLSFRAFLDMHILHLLTRIFVYVDGGGGENIDPFKLLRFQKVM